MFIVSLFFVGPDVVKRAAQRLFSSQVKMIQIKIKVKVRQIVVMVVVKVRLEEMNESRNVL